MEAGSNVIFLYYRTSGWEGTSSDPLVSNYFDKSDDVFNMEIGNDIYLLGLLQYNQYRKPTPN